MINNGRHNRGRHRAPTATGRRLAATVISAGAGAATLGLLPTAPAAEAATPDVTPAAGQSATALLDAIAYCESGRNPHASNGSHFGAYQFDLATWHSVGGAGDPRDASFAEQTARARTLLAQRGTQPWDASKGCWSRLAGAGRAVPAGTSSGAPSSAVPADGDRRAADGSGTYTCDTAHLAYAACNPGNLGERVAYPLYDGHAPSAKVHVSAHVDVSASAAPKHRAAERTSAGAVVETADESNLTRSPRVSSGSASGVASAGASRRPGASVESYLVRRGDTLSGIAAVRPAAVTWPGICAENALASCDVIHPAQRLRITG